MAGVKIPIGAQLDTGDVQAQLEKFKQQINVMGKTIAAANKVQFNPVDKAAVEDMRRVATQMEQLRRVSAEMRRRLKATGQTGAGFFDVNWGALYPNENVRARQMRRAFEYVTGFGFSNLPVPVSPPGLPAPLAPSPQRPTTPAIWQGSIVGGILGRGAQGALLGLGSIGGVAAQGIGTSMRQGFAAGAGGMVGGLLALGLQSAIGGVRARVGRVEQESINYDSLKRGLGDVGVGFEALRRSLHAASDAIDTTYEETQGLARQFATLAGLTREQAGTVAQEVRVTGGFARAFGLEPSRANAFFAQMRQVGITGTTDDTRRLALMIGEAVARSGVFTKADEVMQAVAGYSLTQTRQSLTPANVEGFAGMLAAMMASRSAGLDVQGSAAILGQMNAAVMRGGAAGEAGQMFSYRLNPDLNPVQAQLLWEQGLFGTRSNAFGRGSPYYDFARMFGGTRPGRGGSTNLASIEGGLRRLYLGRPGGADLMLDAFAHYMGLNLSQAARVLTINPMQMGLTGAALDRLHIPLSSLSATGIESLVQIATGSRADLARQAAGLRGRTGDQALTPDERAALDRAEQGGNTEQLRDVLMRLSATREQEQTEGSQTRRSINDFEKAFNNYAQRLIPLANDTRNAVVFLAGNHGRMTARQINEAIWAGEQRDLHGQYEGRRQAVNAHYNALVEPLEREGGAGRLRSLWDQYQQTGDPKLLAQIRELESKQQATQAAIQNYRKQQAAEIAQLDADEAAEQRALRLRQNDAGQMPGRLPVGGGGYVNGIPGAYEGAGGDANTDEGPGTDDATGLGTEGFVKHFEGFTGTAKWDNHQYSNGYGTRARYAGERIDRPEAERRLQEELADATTAVDAAARDAGMTLNANQREALIDFAFNCGTGALADVMREAHGDPSRIPALIAPYNKIGDQPSADLINRRRQEGILFGRTTPLPDEGWADVERTVERLRHAQQQSSNTTMEHRVVVTVLDRAGSQIAAGSSAVTSVGAPQPWGIS